MTNVTSQLDELSFISQIAQFILEANDIKIEANVSKPLNDDEKVIQQKQVLLQNNMENSQIKEEESKIRKYFDEFKETDDFKFLSPVQIVDKLCARQDANLTLKKFIKAFRYDHGKRFAFK